MIGEWRVKKRYPMTAWVDLTVPVSGSTRRGYVTNISREGVGLYYLGAVGEGTEVAVTLHMLGPNGSEIVEDVEGHIVWEDHWGGITIMGVKFNTPLGATTPTVFERLSQAERAEGQQASAALLSPGHDTSTLTRQEQALLVYMMQGLSDSQIAVELKVTPDIVGQLRSAIYAKVGLQGVSQLFWQGRQESEQGNRVTLQRPKLSS